MNKLRQLVNESQSNPVRPRRKQPTKKAAGNKGQKGSSEIKSKQASSTLPADGPVAAARTPVTQGSKIDRWKLFATTYIFGNQDEKIPPFNEASSMNRRKQLENLPAQVQPGPWAGYEYVKGYGAGYPSPPGII